MATSIVKWDANQTRDIISNAGKVVGTMLTFGGGESASELKARLKANGMKGKALTLAVNDILCGKADVRKVEAVAALQAMFDQGFVPDHVKARNKTGSLHLVRPVDPEIAKREKLILEAEKNAAIMAAQAVELAQLRQSMRELVAANEAKNASK